MMESFVIFFSKKKIKIKKKKIASNFLWKKKILHGKIKKPLNWVIYIIIMCKLVWCSNPNGEPFCGCRNGSAKTWDEIRYNIEKDNNMIEDVSTRNKHANVCIIGYYKNDYDSNKNNNTPLFALDPSVDLSKCDDVIILRRVPLKTIRNRHVPRRIAEMMASLGYQNKQMEIEDRFRNNEDETIRLKCIQQMTRLKYLDRKRLPKQYPHPSDAIIKDYSDGCINAVGNRVLWKDMCTTKVNQDYYCSRCANYFSDTIHHESDCPSKDIPEWISMKDRPTPLGIPKSRMRRISWNDDNETNIINAKYIDFNGDLWDLA